MKILRLSLQILFEKRKANMIQQILRKIFLWKLFAWRGKFDLQLSCSAIDNVRKNAIYLLRKCSHLGLSINFSAIKSCSFFFCSRSFKLSLCMLILHNESRRSCHILPRKYVLTLRKQEKDRSSEALEIARTPFIFNSFTTSGKQSCRLNFYMYSSSSDVFSLWKSFSLLINSNWLSRSEVKRGP